MKPIFFLSMIEITVSFIIRCTDFSEFLNLNQVLQMENFVTFN